jgi:hypothetical protein
MRRFLIALFLLTSSLQAQSPQPRKVLDDMIQALGGQAYLDVNDIHTMGRFYQFKRGDLAGLDNFSDYVKFPLAERTEFGKDKNKEITINNGENGWKITPKDKDPKEQVPAEIQDFKASFKTSLDYVLRFTLSAPQTTIQYLGSEIVDFNRADVIEIRDPAKNKITLYIDRSTKFPTKMQVRRADEKITREEHYANWHSFQGIQTPLFLGRFSDGEKTMEIRLDTAVYNSSLPDTLFTVAKK